MNADLDGYNKNSKQTTEGEEKHEIRKIFGPQINADERRFGWIQ